MSLTRRRAEALLSQFDSRTVSVLGDLMLDRYLYGVVHRISPEAPVPVVRVRSEKLMPGGAGNVACNVRAMGGRADVCGWIGADPEGRQLRHLLRKQGVGLDGVCDVRGGRTIVKTRILADHQQVVRVDWDEAPGPTPADAQRFRQMLRRVLRRSDALIVEDYGKGALTQATVNAALRTAASARIPAGLDPKNNGLKITDVRIATPNRAEAFSAADVEDTGADTLPRRDRSLLRVGEILLDRWQAESILITLGAWGMMLFERGQKPHHVPTRAREVFDVSGAGDTVIAVCLLALAAGAETREAAELANYAAGIVVGKIGTATCTPDELLRAVPL